MSTTPRRALLLSVGSPLLLAAVGSKPSSLSPKAKAEATYNAAADHFDDEPLSFWARYGQRTVDRLALAPGARVLDVGCGSGASAIPAAELVGPNGHVIGVDLAEELLQLGRLKAAERELENIEFRDGDMERLGFPDGHFDAVVCVFAIFFSKDMEKQVAELWRTIRPGGQLAITTWGQRIFEPASAMWWESVRQERPDLVSSFRPWERIADPPSLRRLLLDSGVAVAEVVAEEGRQRLRGPEDWWKIVLGSGYRWTVEQLGPRAAARVREHNIAWVRRNRVSSVETNVVYAVATKPLPQTERATPREVIAKVREAAALLEERGAAGLEVIRDCKSRFTWKDTYTFVVNCDADEVMANSAFPERQGGDIKRHTDYNGKRYGPELCTAAKQPGGGWIEYVWLKPGGDKPLRKISYVVSVPGRPYQLGAGIYDETITIEELNRISATPRPLPR